MNALELLMYYLFFSSTRLLPHLWFCGPGTYYTGDRFSHLIEEWIFELHVVNICAPIDTTIFNEMRKEFMAIIDDPVHPNMESVLDKLPGDIDARTPLDSYPESARRKREDLLFAFQFDES